MKRLNATTLAVFVSAIVAADGCDRIPTPEGFVELKPVGAYSYRAVSADGAVILVRSVENPKQGTLAFWTQAVKNELVASRGYTLDGESAVKTKGGLAGTELTMRTHLEGVEYLYVVTLFVRGNRVVIVEATGPKTALTPSLPKIREAIRSVGSAS
jgi:hypothetical protein